MDNIRIVHKRKTNKLHNRDGQRSQKEETKSDGANQVDQWGTDNRPSGGSASIPLTKALQRGVATVTVGFIGHAKGGTNLMGSFLKGRKHRLDGVNRNPHATHSKGSDDVYHTIITGFCIIST
jgi:hypothetical protein